MEGSDEMIGFQSNQANKRHVLLDKGFNRGRRVDYPRMGREPV